MTVQHSYVWEITKRAAPFVLSQTYVRKFSALCINKQLRINVWFTGNQSTMTKPQRSKHASALYLGNSPIRAGDSTVLNQTKSLNMFLLLRSKAVLSLP